MLYYIYTDIHIPLILCVFLFFLIKKNKKTKHTISRRHRNLPPLQLNELEPSPSGRILGVAHEMKSPNPLPIEAQVLAKALCHTHLHPTRDKLSHGPGVIIQIPRRETLIRRVEEWEYSLPLTQRGDGLPLGPGGVKTRGVVRAGMQKDDIPALRVSFQCADHAVEIEGAGLGVVVWVENGLDGASGGT